MRTALGILLLAAFAFTAAADTNITGKWSGSFSITNSDGENKDATAFMVLKQSGTEITGTVGPDESQQFAIGKGKIEGDKITMEAEIEGGTVKFELVLASEHIKGEANMSGEGHSAKAKLDVTRVK